MICCGDVLAVLIGTAKPMPTEPLLPVPVAIWELMPITRRGVDQRAAGVAGVDRGVGLDDVGDREAVGGADLALQRGDDPAVTVRSSPKGLPIATTASPTLTVEESPSAAASRRARPDRPRGPRRRCESSAPRTFGVERVAVAELDRDRARAIDDVGVGEDVAVAVDQEAGAGCGAAA